jgi:hypothetical protein
MTKIDKRYAKKEGIPVTLKSGNKFIVALLIFGTYKTYDINLWHREFIQAIRYTNNILNYTMDEWIVTLYYTL